MENEADGLVEWAIAVVAAITASAHRHTARISADGICFSYTRSPFRCCNSGDTFREALWCDRVSRPAAHLTRTSRSHGTPTSQFTQVLFKQFFATAVMGLGHGLILLPVLLSLVGPAAYR